MSRTRTRGNILTKCLGVWVTGYMMETSTRQGVNEMNPFACGAMIGMAVVAGSAVVCAVGVWVYCWIKGE